MFEANETHKESTSILRRVQISYKLTIQGIYYEDMVLSTRRANVKF